MLKLLCISSQAQSSCSGCAEAPSAPSSFRARLTSVLLLGGAERVLCGEAIGNAYYFGHIAPFLGF